MIAVTGPQGCGITSFLQQLADRGPDAFYDGPIAERLTADMAARTAAAFTGAGADKTELRSEREG